MGRWAARGSADVYVRTAARVIENLQTAAAVHAQESYNYGPDFFGEEHSLEELLTWLRCKGTSEILVTDQIEALSCADYSLEVEAHRVTVEPFGREAKRFKRVTNVHTARDDEDTVSLDSPIRDGVLRSQISSGIFPERFVL